MFKRFIAVCGLLVALTVVLVFPASAAEVTPEIKLPTRHTVERLINTAPVSIEYNGNSYNLDKHFYIYSNDTVYDKSNGGLSYDGFAKLYCYAFDNSLIEGFNVGPSYNYMAWDSVSDSSLGNVFRYYYNFALNEWVYDGVLPDQFGTYSIRGKDAVLYSDFQVGAYLKDPIPSNTVFGVDDVTWQTLTWNEIKSFDNVLISEIFGILPVILSFVFLSIAIHKGVKFLFGFVRQG